MQDKIIRLEKLRNWPHLIEEQKDYKTHKKASSKNENQK